MALRDRASTTADCGRKRAARLQRDARDAGEAAMKIATFNESALHAARTSDASFMKTAQIHADNVTHIE